MPAWLVKVLPFLRNLLPVNKIAAWIVGVALVAVVGVIGADKEKALAELCDRNPSEEIAALEKAKIALEGEVASLKLENDLLKSKK